jgi:hypothetical protein
MRRRAPRARSKPEPPGASACSCFAPRSFGSSLLSPPTLAALQPWVPGKIGRWSRRIRTGANILRTVMRVAA